MRPSSRRLAALSLILGLLSGQQLGAAPAPLIDYAGPTVAYHAGTLANGGTSVEAAYEGEPLVLQSTYVGRNAPEPTIGLNPRGVAFMSAYNDVVRSTDGGLSWEEVGAKVGGVATPPTNLDPYVYVDRDTGRVFQPQLYAACSWMNISDDEGESWIPNPVACGSFVNDHQTITTGKPPAGLPTVQYPNVVYYCFNRVVDSNCSRSLDGGLTFTPTRTPAFLGFDPAVGLCGGLHGHLETDSTGRVYLPKGHCNRPWLAMSDDAGDTWTRVQITDEFRSFDTHEAIAIDDENNLYYLFMDEERKLPWLAWSTDRGTTWSEPVMVAPPGVKETNFPILTAGARGRVAIQFPGSLSDDRDDPRRPWNAYTVVSTTVLDTEPVFLSTTANNPADPIHRGPCGTGSNTGRCGGMLDFLDIRVSPVDGWFWGAATDTCHPSCGASPNGSAGQHGLAIRQVGGPRLRDVAPAPGG